jgi:molybdenum cofactor synthesis domain-containing protein
VTVSDRVSRAEADDLSGPRAAAILAGLGFDAEVRVVPDGVESVGGALDAGVAEGFPLVVTTGGTGMSARDLTPEATQLVIEREAPGLSEAMRAAAFGTNPHGMLSRGVSGVAGSTLIVNLPGSVAGVEESLAVIGPALRHAVDLITGVGDGH